MLTLPTEEYPSLIDGFQHGSIFNIFLKLKRLSQPFQQHKAEFFIKFFLVREHVFKQNLTFDIKKPALQHPCWKPESLQDREPSLKRYVIKLAKIV